MTRSSLTQQSLHAAHTDGVSSCQFLVRDAGTAIEYEIAYGLATKPIDDAPGGGRRTRVDGPTLGNGVDCHVHIAVNVTERQLAHLRPAIVFAMTREPSEAHEASMRFDPDVVWGCGASSRVRGRRWGSRC